MTIWRKPKSPAKATPGMEMMVRVEVSAETMEREMAHQGMVLLGEEVVLERTVFAGLSETEAEERDAD